MLRLTFSFIMLFCAVLTHAQPAPRRIVSMNLCTDQLLLLLVDRSRIASLSYFATNPDYSPLAAQAQGIPANRGQTEEVLAFEPDLILTSQFSATLAANLLERLGHPVQRFGFAETADEVYTHIQRVALLTGTQAQGERLIADLLETISREQALLQPRLQGKSAVFFASNGFSYGADTLQHDFLLSLGLRNIAADAGLSGPAPLPLEVLLAAEPDFIFTDRRSALDAQLAHPLMQHPALGALQGRTRMLELPDVLFQCAGPQFAEAYRVLSAQLAAPIIDEL